MPNKDTSTLFGTRSSLFHSVKQPSKNLATPQNQEWTFSSTTKSHHEAVSGIYSHNVAFEPGFIGSCKNEEDSLRTHLSFGNEDHFKSPFQMEHNQPVVSPQVIEFTPPRAVVPLDCTKGMPVYVNAKQYNAIVRRRQTRAKLEAQNKLTRSRKTYLHESRHLHALKRARGSSGRFLNTNNKMKESKPYKENNSWVASTTSSSDRDHCVFQQPQIESMQWHLFACSSTNQ